MIRYIKNFGNNLIKFDDQTFETSALYDIYSGIDWVWVLDEDGMLDDKPVKAGNVVIRFYPPDKQDMNANKEYVVISNPEICNYYKRALAAQKIIADRAAKAKLCDNTCNCDAHEAI